MHIPEEIGHAILSGMGRVKLKRKFGLNEYNAKKYIKAMKDEWEKTKPKSLPEEDFYYSEPYNEQLYNSVTDNSIDPEIIDPLKIELEKLKLTPGEVKKVIRGFKNSSKINRSTRRIDIPDKHFRFGVISDLHIGHKEFRQDIFEFAVEKFKKEDVDFIVNSGDTLEGMSGRKGHIYELEDIGWTAQCDRFVKLFEMFHLPVRSIEAEGSHTGLFKTVGDQGVDAGIEMDVKSDKYDFLGYDEQDIVLDNGIKIRLVHPGGGTSYAISYNAQKYINSLSGGKKPHIIIQGHYHKALYIFYRNIHHFEAGTMQNQTIFMRKKNAPAMLGFWIIDVRANSKTKWCCEIGSKFFPFYE